VVVLAIVLVVAILALVACAARKVVGGAVATAARAARRTGPDYTKSPHIVVDTLNLTHWLTGAKILTPALIAETIDRTAPILAAKHSGRIMYVLKDRESQLNSAAAHAVYRATAERNRVYLLIAERYALPPESGITDAKSETAHSGRGRDDFFMSLLAHRHRCAVVTDDRLRDFSDFRKTIKPFHVIEFAFWRAMPTREPIRPESLAYARLRPPRAIRPETYFAQLRT
jgi:hypothetical protein